MTKYLKLLFLVIFLTGFFYYLESSLFGNRRSKAIIVDQQQPETDNAPAKPGSQIVLAPEPTTDMEVMLDADEIFELTNKERLKNDLPPLIRDKALDTSAKLKTEDMFAGKYWEHTSPDGEQPWDFIKQAGFQFGFAGENLAKDFKKSHEVVDSWMKSRVHRENILNPNYTHIGVHVSVLMVNGSDFWSVVQHFASLETANVQDQ